MQTMTKPAVAKKPKYRDHRGDTLRVVEFRADLPLHPKPLHALKLEGADMLETLDGERVLAWEIQDYRDKCVDIELELREAGSKLDAEYLPDIAPVIARLAEIKEEIAEARQLINDERQLTRSRESLPQVEARIKKLQQERYPLQKAVREAKDSVTLVSRINTKRAKIAGNRGVPASKEKWREALVKLEEKLEKLKPKELKAAKAYAVAARSLLVQAGAKYKQLYHDSPLYAYVKSDIERAVQKSRGKPDCRKKRPDGCFTVYAQLAPPRPWSALFNDAGPARVQHAPVSPVKKSYIPKNGKHAGERREVQLGGAKGQQRYILRLRFAACKDGWVEMPFTFRPDRMPEDAIISGVRLCRRRLGPRFQWLVQFTVASQHGFDRVVGRGTVGVCLEWRTVKNGLHVATCVKPDGSTSSLVLPNEDYYDKWQRAAQIQGEAKTRANEKVKELCDWLKTKAGSRAPAWLRETKNLHKYHAKSLAKLVWRWHDNRFVGDEAIFAGLEEWRKKNRKWSIVFRHISSRTDRRRNQAYREFARNLCNKYGEVHVLDTDYAARQRRPKAEESAEGEAIRSANRQVSLGKLRAYLFQSGMTGVKCPSVLTRTCGECGHANELSSSKNRFCCESCEHTAAWDVHTATNLLRYKPGRKASKASEQDADAE